MTMSINMIVTAITMPQRSLFLVKLTAFFVNLINFRPLFLPG